MNLLNGNCSGSELASRQQVVSFHISCRSASACVRFREQVPSFFPKIDRAMSASNPDYWFRSSVLTADASTHAQIFRCHYASALPHHGQESGLGNWPSVTADEYGQDRRSQPDAACSMR
jgi:hypothetical protein